MRAGTTLVAFPTRKTLALLAYLALADGAQPRDHLAALLWPEVSPERSRASLRNTLNHLQSALRQAPIPAAPAYLAIARTSLGLNPDAGIELDLEVVEQAYRLARADRAHRAKSARNPNRDLLQAAAAAYRGDFLAGFSLGDAPSFDDWVGVQREVWRRRLGLILDRLSEIQYVGGEFAATAETAATWISLDPLHEGAYRRKMRAHFAAGERGQALETYDACRAALASELQIDPDPVTKALAARIRTGRLASRAAPIPSGEVAPVAFLERLFAGRASEQQTLAQVFARAAAGQPQVALLRGETGIGKTRLAAEFLAWADAQGAVVLSGGAFESGSRLPFQPLVQALRGWLAHDRAAPAHLAEAGLAPLGELLPELRQHRTEPAPSPSAEASPLQIFEAFEQLTLALAGRSPLVLFVDDLQWVDSATLDLLQYLVRRWHAANARVMLAVCLRSESLRAAGQVAGSGLVAWVARMEREAACTAVELRPLSESETHQLLRACLSPPAPDFAAWVYGETRGHPFYLKETLKDLLERGALSAKRQTQGQWAFQVDALHELGKTAQVASTIGAVVRARLFRLSPNAFSLLAAGAVLEHDLTFEDLRRIAHVTEDLALPALDELIASLLLLEAAQPEMGAYAFPNDLIRNVVYTEAGDARRRSFHGRAMELLAAANAPPALLAHHALAAGREEAAFTYSRAAGEGALRLAAPGTAVVHFEQARVLARQGAVSGPAGEAQLREVYRQLATAYAALGQADQAAAVLQALDRLNET